MRKNTLIMLNSTSLLNIFLASFPLTTLYKRIKINKINENMEEILIKDTRVIFVFDEIVYTVSDVVDIYNTCKEALDTTKNELKALYEMLDVKPKKKSFWSRDEVISDIFQRLKILGNSVKDRASFQKEVRKARQKFMYWGDVDVSVYGVIEKMPRGKCNRILKSEIPRDRSFYDCMIALACDLSILEARDISSRIEEEKIFLYKLDYSFVNALKFFSSRFTVTDDLNIDLNALFDNIYNQIRSIGSLTVFSKLCEEMAKNYNKSENRIVMNNSVNTEFPTLWHLALKALTDNSSGQQTIENITYETLVTDVRNAITLLDADNEYDLNFLLPNQESNYLERLMRYSAVYDLHQYDVDGMLFLIEKILCDFQKEIEDFFNETKDCVFSVIKNLVEEGQTKFLNGELHVLSEKNMDAKTKKIVDKIAATGILNKECITPAQWDKVNDDSEWIIKNEDKYYILPPILSMLGIYDKIGIALKWRDFGPQIETAVKDLFASIKDLNVYSGKYLFENKVFECDVIVLGNKYALIIECKRKGISRKGRGGDKAVAIRDIAETYFSSQRQAYHTHRAILENSNKLDLYPSDCDIEIKNPGDFESEKQTIDFSGVKCFIRISCTGGNFWIVAEEGINSNIEAQIGENSDNKYISDFIKERNKLLQMNNVNGRIVKLDKTFISFDKLYDLVSKSGKSGDTLLEEIWRFTRVQDKKGYTTNNMSFILSLGRSNK